ncbi:IS21 family transposase [Clostridium sp. N3C]|uniref:IS21 family transposase n=1 Tax=Clostridium sp. N3C TaxID=1776758 RepID=UPI0009F92B54|nr:IS21 family transposase [Clostridium sp. N3C]
MSRVHCIKELSQFEGKSLREISRITGHAFATVQKYVDKEDFNDIPQRRSKNELKIDKYKELIDLWLEADLTAPRKQRHTAKRVYDRLEELFDDKLDVSLRTVQYYVSAKKKELFSKKEGSLPLNHPAGEAQVDLGEATFIENGEEFTGYYLNMSFPYSNGGYVQVFRGQNQECFLQGMKNIFEHMGRVPYKIWFDNLSAAVISIDKDGSRTLTQQFERFASHYKFQVNFCNPASGNEKGNVENKVGYHRRNLFVPIPAFKNIDDYNKLLLQICDNDMDRKHYKNDVTIKELFNDDLKKMFLLPAVGFEIHRMFSAIADNYGKVKFETNTYSTSPAVAGKKVFIKATAFQVIILDEKYGHIVTHKRLYCKNAESMNWIPYLSTLARRPNALKYTDFYNEMPEPWRDYLDKCDKDKKKLALHALIKMIQESEMKTATTALLQTIATGNSDVDSIIATYHRLVNKLPEIAKMQIYGDIPVNQIFTPNLDVYNKFLKGRNS